MPDLAAEYTSRRPDMTGLIARRVRQRPPRRVGRGHEPGNEFPRLARCSVFKDRSATASEGLSVQARTASRATTQYIGETVLDPALSTPAAPHSAGIA